MNGYFVEFRNGDVGPFRSRVEAELYRAFAGDPDETQVFESSDIHRPFLALAEFCPDALEFATKREP